MLFVVLICYGTGWVAVMFSLGVLIVLGYAFLCCVTFIVVFLLVAVVLLVVVSGDYFGFVVVLTVGVLFRLFCCLLISCYVLGLHCFAGVYEVAFCLSLLWFSWRLLL